MEHSYLGNNYCEAIEYKLLNKPQPLVWLCDYHETNEDCPLTWEDIEEGSLDEAHDTYSDIETKYFVNHSKGLFINSSELAKLSEEGKDEASYYCFPIHPLPILCNSDRESQGGGDYHPEDSRRGTWCLDDIAVYTDKDSFPEDFKDVTEDCVFYE